MQDRNSDFGAGLEQAAFQFGGASVARTLRLAQCGTVEQLSSELSGISAELGFDRYLYGGLFSIDGTKKTELVITNYDSAWRKKYQSESYSRIDPTVSHAVTSLQPLVWVPQVFSTEASLNFKEEAGRYGLVSGITFPIHSKEGDVALLSFANSSGGEDACHHSFRQLPLGLLAATLTHDSVRRIVETRRGMARPMLTRRETEIMKWIYIGKTTWEISRLLNISEHGVSFHVRKVLEKFDVSSRHQAVAKAVSFGLLG